MLKRRNIELSVVKINQDELNALLKENGMQCGNYTYTNYFFPLTSKTKKFYSWSLVGVYEIM